jgi:hypothetical protein
MGRPKKILSQQKNEDFELEEELEDNDIDLSSEDMEQIQQVQNTISPVSDPDDEDIFLRCEKIVKTKGDVPRFQIYVNNSLKDVVNFPYSWDKILQKYGKRTAHIKVKAISLKTGQYLAQQTQMISGEEDDFESSKPVNNQNLQVAAAQNTPSLSEMLTLLTTIGEKSRAESQAIADRQMQMMTTFLTALAPRQENSTALIEKMANSFERITDKLTDQMARMAQEFNHKLELLKAGENVAKNKDLSPFELLKMMNDSRQEGFELFERLNSVAEEKAEEKAELLAQSGGSGDEKKESAVDVLIKTMAPMLAGAFLKTNAPRPNLASGKAASKVFSPTPTQKTLPKPQVESPKPAPKPAPKSVNMGVQISKPVIVTPPPKPVKTAPEPVAVNPSATQASTQTKAKPVIVKPLNVAATPAPNPAQIASKKRAQIYEKLQPRLFVYMTETWTPQDAAVDAAGELLSTGIPVLEAIDLVPASEIIEIAQSAGMGEEQFKWINDWYDTMRLNANSQTTQQTAQTSVQN